MANLTISPAARQDLSDIFDYIARDKPEAAVNWVESIYQKCQLLATMPESGELRPEFGKLVRCCSIGRYVIFFRPLATPGIEIIRVIPGDRDLRTL